MTIRNRDVLNHHWLRTLLSGEPHFIIGSENNPYLLRWFLLPRNHFVNIYLHKFMRSDDDRALHDHPWHFLSIVLKGGYWEHREGQPFFAKRWRPAGSVAFRRAGTLHRVELARHPQPLVNQRLPREAYMVQPEKPVWSLIITGPKHREWGFACPEGWRHWSVFVERGCE